jgi:O-antigen/teichoic acid export membrane protein
MTETDAPARPDDAPSAPPHVSGMMSKAVLWSTLNFAVSHSASIVIFLIIAAQVPPHIFGVIALAAIAADFVTLEGRYAAMNAILQAKRFDETSLRSAFTSFLGIVGVIAVVLALAAPHVSAIYNEPLVATFMPLFGLMLLPVPWIAVMDAQMMRDLRYKQTTQRSISATLISGAIGIAVAFSPWMIWALFVQRLVALVVQTALLYRFTGWLPRLSFQIASATDFVRRFIALWIINTLVVSIGRVTLIVFGLRYDVATVGLLRATNRITEAVQGPVIAPLQGVWFPLMSKVKGDLAAEREVYNSILRTATVIALPAFAGLALVAPDLVNLVLPQEYAGVTPILQASCITMLLIPILWFNNVAMTSLGMNRMSLGYTLTLVALSFVALYMSERSSPAEAILIMAIPAATVGLAGNIMLNIRLKQPNLAYYAGLMPAVLATVAMSAAVAGLSSVTTGWSALPRLLACAAVGAIVYVGWLMLAHRTWFLNCIRTLAGRKIPAAG